MQTSLLQLLPLIEIALKLGAGLALVSMPSLLARILGLPPADPFWPRLLGATLIGLGLATVLDMHYLPGKGLGLHGSTAINLAVAAGIGAQLILGRGTPTRRGQSILGLAAASLTLLALVEIISAA